MGVTNPPDRLVSGNNTAILSSGFLDFSKNTNWVLEAATNSGGLVDGKSIKIKGGNSDAATAGDAQLEGGAGTATAVSGSAIVVGGDGGGTNVGGAVTINGGPGTVAGNISIGPTRGDVNAGRSGGKIGFLGATAIVRPVGTTDLRQALINLGLYTTGGATPLDLNGGALTAATGTFTGLVQANQLQSTVATGTAPLIVASTTKVTNLNCDALDGVDSTGFFILAGQAGGQTANGDTASGGNLTLHSTAHATKGKILIGSNSAYDEANDRLGIGTTAPSDTLQFANGADRTISVKDMAVPGASNDLYIKGGAGSAASGGSIFIQGGAGSIGGNGGAITIDAGLGSLLGGIINIGTSTNTRDVNLSRSAGRVSFFGVTAVGRQSAVGDIKVSLKNYGLLQGTSATPLNLDGGTLTAANGVFTVATGTAPLTITSTTLVANLNVDQLDSLDSTAFFILAGQSGGQIAIGGTGSGDDMTLKSTSHATKGDIFIGSAVTTRFDDVNDILAVGAAAETVQFSSGTPLHVLSSMVVHRYAAGAASGANYFAARARGTQASPTVVVNGDLLNQFTAYGYSGAATNFVNAAAIAYFVDAVPDSGGDTTDMPGRIAFYTCLDSTATLTERLRITNVGATLFGNISAQFGNEVVGIQAADNGTCLGLKINAAQASITAADIFIEFRSTTGVEGSVAGTAVAGVIAYNTFTGCHYTRIDDRVSLEPLMLLEATGEDLDDPKDVQFDREEKYLFYIGPPEEASGYLASEPVPGYIEERAKTATYTRRAASKEQTVKSRICKKRRSKAVWGVYGGTNPDGMDLVLSIGTGYILVSNRDDIPLEVGDYLMSTDLEPGCCERQDTDGLMNYTVAKALAPIVWEPGERRRKIPCTYHCG